MADLFGMLQAAAGAVGEQGPDPNFNQTVLLLHGDGTNGAQNNTFLDSSTNNFTITRDGNTTQGTFSPFSAPDGRWSNYFDGVDDYLRGIGTTSDFNFCHNTTALCTIECWVYKPVFGSTRFIVGNRGSTTKVGFVLAIDSNNKLQFLISYGSSGNTVVNAISTAVVNSNEWVHVCAEWDYVSNSGTIYINGAVDTTFSRSNTASTSNAAYALVIGASDIGSADYEGYISNLRISNSIVYGGAFTPSTEPLTTTSQSATNVELLTCQSNRFVDNSSNGYSATINGTPKITPFSPFAPTAAYDASVNGGSGYFDGSGDTIYVSAAQTTPLIVATDDDFSIECWVYFNALATSFFVSWWDTSGTRFRFGVKDSDLELFAGVQSITGSLGRYANEWIFCAVSREAGAVKLFVNGQQVGTTVTGNTRSFNKTDQNYYIGSLAGSQSYVNGYIAGFRQIIGTAVDYASLGVPTAPPTAITNTELLLNFTNAGIFDNTGKNNLETVGDAQIDTTVKKFGTGSMEFDGAGDWLLMPDNPDLQLGTGDFTIEFWVYLATGDTGSNRGLVAKGTSTTGFLVSLNTTQKVVFTFTTSTITSTGAITLDAWNHIAVVREGTGSNQTKIYIAGTNDGTGTVSTNFNQTSVMYVGANRTAGDPMKGFIDDLRITKGIARYTAAFTPPAQAFPNL